MYVHKAEQIKNVLIFCVVSSTCTCLPAWKLAKNKQIQVDREKDHHHHNDVTRHVRKIRFPMQCKVNTRVERETT